MRLVGSPISRSTPTVSRRSSTSIIVSASRNTVDGDDRDDGDGEVKALEHAERARAAAPASAAGRAASPGRRAFTSRENASASAPGVSRMLMASTDSAPSGASGGR